MSERYKIHYPNDLYFVTLTIVGWIDLFTRRDYCEVIIENLKFCKEHKGLNIHAYVIMSSHIHMIVSSDRREGLAKTLREFKSYTARLILELVYTPGESRKEWLMHNLKFFANRFRPNREHMVWKADNHPIHLWSKKVTLEKLNYIHENPRAAGLTYAPEYWVYSSLSNYLDMPSKMEVSLLDIAYEPKKV